MKRPAVDSAIEALWNEPLEETDFARRLRLALAELDGEEYENLISLIRWFQRRYPTPASRLAYARRKAKEECRPSRRVPV